jgi:hypothetical protein
MQIGGENIENMFVNMMVKRNLKKYTNPKIHLWMPIYSGMGLKNSSLKLSK